MDTAEGTPANVDAQQQFPGGGMAAPLPPPTVQDDDHTDDLIASLDLPSSPPKASALVDLFRNLLRHRDGRPLRLPVTPWVYHEWGLREPEAARELLEPEAPSGAWSLSVLVSSALHPRMQLMTSGRGDAPGVAERVGDLFGRILCLMASHFRREGCAFQVKRAAPSASQPHQLPAFMALLDHSLMLKGEYAEKGDSVEGARQRLKDSVKGWAQVYGDEIEYMLCYACAGSHFELLSLSRGNEQLTCLLQADIDTLTGKAAVMRAAILVYDILFAQRRRQLPRSAPLLHTARRGGGGGGCHVELTFLDCCVLKVASWARMRQLGADLHQLRRLYDAVSGCPYVVHASEESDVGEDGLYRVTLVPRAVAVDEDWRPCSLEHLARAFRCVLLGVRAIHDAGFGHADLHWGNVVRTRGDRFILVDLEKAVQLDSFQGNRRPELDMPYAWADGAALVDGCFTAASDLFMLGRMLRLGLGLLAPSNDHWLEGCDPSEDAPQAAARRLAEQLVSKSLGLEEAVQHEWLRMYRYQEESA